MSQINFNKAFVVLLLLFITAVFTAMIWPFLMTIIMAAIFSGLTRPMYRGLKRGLPKARFCTNPTRTTSPRRGIFGGRDMVGHRPA